MFLILYQSYDFQVLLWRLHIATSKIQSTPQTMQREQEGQEADVPGALGGGPLLRGWLLCFLLLCQPLITTQAQVSGPRYLPNGFEEGQEADVPGALGGGPLLRGWSLCFLLLCQPLITTQAQVSGPRYLPNGYDLFEKEAKAWEFEMFLATCGIFLCMVINVLGMLPNQSSGEHDEEEYLVSEGDLGRHKVRTIQGNKKTSTWLVVDEQYIMHRNDESPDGKFHYWECSHRRKQANCR